MQRLLKAVWHDIRRGENIDIYVTVIAAVTVAFLNLIGIAKPLAEPLILAVLAILAASTISNRNMLNKSLNRMEQLTTGVLLDQIPSGREETLRDAKELWMTGIALNKTINTHHPLLEEKLKKGDRIKVLVVDPDGISCQLLPKRKYQHTTKDEVRKYIRLTLTSLCRLRESAPAPTGLEIRVLDFPPPFGIIGADLDSHDESSTSSSTPSACRKTSPFTSFTAKTIDGTPSSKSRSKRSGRMQRLGSVTLLARPAWDLEWPSGVGQEQEFVPPLMEAHSHPHTLSARVVRSRGCSIRPSGNRSRTPPRKASIRSSCGCCGSAGSSCQSPPGVRRRA
jgi:hypothetical protein